MKKEKGIRQKKYRWIFLAGILICVFGFFIGRKIYLLNQKYPDPERVFYHMNDEMNVNGCKFRVESAEFWTPEAMKEKYPEFVMKVTDYEGESISDERWKNLVVGVRFLEADTSEQMIEAKDRMVLKSDTWRNGWDLDWYYALNDTSKPIEAGDIIYLSYFMFDFQFRKDDWENVEKREFELVTSTYPVLHSVRFDDIGQKTKEDVITEREKVWEENMNMKPTMPDEVIASELKAGNELVVESNIYQIESAVFMTSDEVEEVYPNFEMQYTDDLGNPLGFEKYAVMMVGIRIVQSENPDQIRDYNITLKSGDWMQGYGNGYDKEIYLEANDALNPYHVGDVIYLPFSFRDDTFTKEEWPGLAQREYTLEIPLYYMK